MRKTLYLTRYDASLNTDWCNAHNNAELTLTLRLGFRQINPPGGAATGTYNDYGKATGKPRKIIKWTAATLGGVEAELQRVGRTVLERQVLDTEYRGLLPAAVGATDFHSEHLVQIRHRP